MKILRILGLFLVAGSCVAAEPTWNPADAVKEAEQDIRTGHIKFYWSGSIASMPVGVPIEVAKKYPNGTVFLQRQGDGPELKPKLFSLANQDASTPAPV